MWTLWGMGLSGLGALIAVGLAFLSQSPRFLARSGLGGYRLDLRTRSFTGYAFALLLLAFGFFLAGVPLGPQAGTSGPLAGLEATVTVTIAGRSTAITASGTVTATAASGVITPSINLETTPSRPVTGAFPGPPGGATEAVPAEEEEVAPGGTTSVPAEPATAIATAIATATATLAPSPTITPTLTPTETPTNTPTPTETPTPTLTPTPIEGETAVINTGGSTLQVRRTPGSQVLAQIEDGAIVILLPGHANQGGILWREVSTTEGVVGWVQEEFLRYEQ
jgi:hypothetical protein